jgi:hypothetical protein
MQIWKWRYEHRDMEKRKTEAQTIFLIPFTVCSSYKWKFVICPCLDKETSGYYLFANGLNILNGLAHLCPAPELGTDNRKMTR